MSIAPIIVLGVIGTILFIAPHYERSASRLRKRSLAGCLVQLLDPDAFRNPGRALMWAAAVLGCISVFVPALGAACVQVAASVNAARWMLLGFGLLSIAAGVSAFLLITLTHLSFGFGSQSPVAPATPMARVIPIYLGLCGLAGIVGAIHPTAAGWLVR